MGRRKAVRRLFATLTVVLLISAMSPAAAQAKPPQPGGGPSATNDRYPEAPADKGPIIAPVRPHGAAGGTDVQLGGTNEPAVTVNPLDGNNVAMASLFALRVSTNNGTSFTAPTAATVPATHGLCGDPSLAFDSQGRLFWTYLGCIAGSCPNCRADVFIAQVNPATGAILAGYPINVTASAGVNLPAASGFSHDKEWLAADHNAGSASPFQDRLYIVWTQFGVGASGTAILTTFSTNQGQTWSAPLTLSVGAEGFVWPSHNAVAANGDVYVTYHSQPGFRPDPNPADNDPSNPNGTSGQVFVLRSTDGGVSYPQKSTPYTAGNADITSNVQSDAGRALNGSASWTQGSAQPWVLPDPINPNNVYVVAADDPTNANHGAGFDDMDIFIARSTNQGGNWNAPARVDAGPVGTTQFFPTASIDSRSQCLAVAWYDMRAGVTNAAGRFLLDVFERTSCDGGVNFGPEVQLNDVRFNPDLGANPRFAGPPPTLRIGEYIGIAIVNGSVTHAVWTGNTAAGQQIVYDNTVAAGAVDVYFLVDLSGSFADDLPNFKAQAPNIISTLLAGNANTRFGIGRFEDYPIDPFGSAAAGDKAYERVLDLSFNSALVLSTINGLTTRDGLDLPQSQLTALRQAADGTGQDLSGAGFPQASIPAGQQANFRTGATKIFLMWTDAAFHQPGDPGNIPYPGASFTDTANAILAIDPGKVIGISSGTAGFADLQQIALATNTLAPPGGVDCNNDGIIDVAGGQPLVCAIGPSGEGIGEAILATVEAAAVPFKVKIDIKPGSSPSPIRLSSSGKIPVAILSTPNFDAPSQVDKASLTFGRNGYEKSLASCSTTPIDVDLDGLLDQICQFNTQLTGFQIDDTEGILRGTTVSGLAIEGRDPIRIVPT
jgi:Integrin beta chain VWA domain